MKKIIAVLFFFLLLIGLYRVFNQPAVSPAINEEAMHSLNDQKVGLVPLDDPSISSREVGPNYGSPLTYARLKEDINSDIIKSSYVKSIAIPANVKYQDSFVKPEPEKGTKGIPKKIRYNFNIEDATGPGDVRIMDTKVGVEYHVSQDSAVGVEAIRGIHDSQDASAWGKSVKDENTAQVKYKKFF